MPEMLDQLRYEARRHRARRPADNLSWRVQLRRWWWRLVRRHDGEICASCGRPVALSCPSWWQASNGVRKRAGEGKQS